MNVYDQITDELRLEASRASDLTLALTYKPGGLLAETRIELTPLQAIRLARGLLQRAEAMFGEDGSSELPGRNGDR